MRSVGEHVVVVVVVAVMAAPGKNCIRVRLHFDFPPPAVVDCRMCWMLVDTSSCRFIADLESVVRDKFEFSQGSILSLFIEDCYLPHTESVLVVRDNDCIRVRLDTVNQVNGHSPHLASPSRHSQKRRRETDVPAESATKEDWKTKKRKKTVEDENVSVDDDAKKLVVKNSGKKKRLLKETAKTASSESGASPKTVSASVKQAVPLSKKKKDKVQSGKSKTQKNRSSSSSSSSSSEEEAAPQKLASKAQKSQISVVPKKPQNSKPTIHKALPPPVTDSSTHERLKLSPQKKAKPIEESQKQAKTHKETKTHDASNVEPLCSDTQLGQSISNGEEIELVIHRPVWPPNFSLGGHLSKQGQNWGKGRGRDVGGESGGARGRNNNSNGYHDSSYQTDVLSNSSVVIQNGAQTLKPDYSAMPLLAAPPPVGQKIAFKLLELTENYSPEVSDYKEGKIVSFDPTSQQIELELLHTSQAAAGEPGRFDLVYQNPDGTERVEYAVSRGSWVTERWDSLLEPRLII